jgi:exonuclease 1
MSYIGQRIDPKVATGVARGLLHPQTKMPLKILKLDMKQIPPPSLRKTQTPSTLDMKKHKPIDSFFKSKRTPLAELDPNSFIMTPQQESLARRASNTSWSSQLAPVNEYSLPRTGPRHVPAESERLGSHPVDIDTPSMTRAKRQRLCHDDTAAPVTPVAHVMSGRSKFFTSSVKSKKRRPSPEFGIFSDVDLEVAFMAIPDH